MNLPPLLRIALGLTSLFGCTLEAERRGLLADCTFNDECEAPLICAARRCRAPCRTDRDCTNDWVCLPSGQEDRLVCYPRGTDDCRVAYPYEPNARCVLADHTCDAHPRYAADGGVATD